MTIIEQVEELREDIRRFSLKSAEDLEQFRIKYLGSKNILKPFFGRMKEVDASERKEFGRLLNEIKSEAEFRYQEASTTIKKESEDRKRRYLDVTLPGNTYPVGSRHPVQLVIDRISQIFKKIGYQIVLDREIETEWYNFTALNTPEDHPARDMTDTFYLDADQVRILRSQTSTVQIRVMESQQPPIRIISPGRVYRNETISARSHCQFHQIEGLYIDKGVSFSDLKQTLLYYAREMYGPDAKIRLRPSYFPFTEPSAEVDVYWGLETESDHRITKGTGWLEVMGCGMVDPAVLENCGIDPDIYSGFAFGMGIERQAMLQFKVTDIRAFFENDVRFLQQFHSVIYI